MPALTKPAAPMALAGRLGIRGRRGWIMFSVLIVAGTYLAYTVLFEGWTYLELKASAKAAPAQLRKASWRDPALVCPGDPGIGAQLDRLFDKGYDGFVTRMLWDTLPPRYELFITGMAAPRQGLEPRYLVLTVDLDRGDRAALRDAVIAGESAHLESAKQWLAAACSK